MGILGPLRRAVLDHHIEPRADRVPVARSMKDAETMMGLLAFFAPIALAIAGLAVIWVVR